MKKKELKVNDKNVNDKNVQLAAVEQVKQTVQQLPQATQCVKIWNYLKNKDIDLFAIKKKVSDYCEMVEIDPNKCHLVSKASAVYPVLEDNFGHIYNFSKIDKYIVVEKK